MLSKVIKDYIDHYDFSNTIDQQHKNLISKCTNLYKKFGDEKFLEFIDRFWSDPTTPISKLKKDLSIPNNIAFSSIIKAYNHESYLKFIKDCWDDSISIDSFLDMYRINYSKINELIVQFKFIEESKFCPTCWESKEFIVDLELEDIKNKNIYMNCILCGNKIVSYEDLISYDTVEKLKSERNEKIKNFENKMQEIDIKLKEVKCSKCQSINLELDASLIDFSYSIKCSECKSSWESFDILKEDYEKWLQRAAMMIRIKEKEEELVKEKLKNKKPYEILFAKEQIIEDTEGYNAIGFAIDNNNDMPLYWKELFKQIKLCSKPELILLEKAIQLCKDSDIDDTWNDNYTGESVVLKKYSNNEEPIVCFLFEETGILGIRKILRNLMAKNLIACGEETSFILTSKILIEKLEAIKSLLKPQNISNDIRFLILKNHNYTCYNCGESDRSLKIGFLSVDKNINNLSSMVPICNFCYDDITENEVLIDGSITSFDFNNRIDEFVSWSFLNTYIPIVKDPDQIYKEHCMCIDTYGEEVLIKALAITLYNLTKKYKKITSIQGVYNYAKAVIENNDDNIYINEKIKQEYDVDYWIAKL